MVEATHPSPPPAQAPPTSLYELSTQHKDWRYSVKGLHELRASLNKAAVEAVRNAFEKDEPGSSSSISFLTPDEELLLVKLYIGKVKQLCGHFRMPESVEATAITYIRRFYLRNTVMDWHPKNVMLTSIFLATKTTNNPIPLDTYAAHIPKTKATDVLDLEFLVAQSLGFQFTTWSAHRALWGIYLDAQTLPSLSFETLQKAYLTALTHARISRLTDVELIYTPSQIALACLRLADPSIASLYLASKMSPNEAPTSVDMDRLLDTIARVITDAAAEKVDLEAVREIDRRLKICTNPEKVEGSGAWKRKQAEEEQRQAEKRARKAQDDREKERDPFGSELADYNTNGAEVPGLEAKGGLDDDDD